MRRIIDGLAVICIIGLLVAVAHQCGCSPAVKSHEENVLIAGSYAAQLQACVDKAKTLEESQACRCEVSKRNNRPCDVKDAGGE